MNNQEILSRVKEYFDIGEYEIINSIRSHYFDETRQQIRECIPEIQEEELNSFIEWYAAELSKKYDTPENIAAINAYEEKKRLSTVSCPYCHSTNTKKISTASKALNTAVWGILGTKRHKQWHCNNCKSDF